MAVPVSVPVPVPVPVRVRMRSRREQGEQREGDEVAERRLGPTHFSSTLEPGGIDEENDGRDDDFAEPPDHEEQRREHDAPETQLRKTYCGCEVEHVPCEPEQQRPEQERCDQPRKRNGKPTSDEGADPKDSQHYAEDWIHKQSLRRGRCGTPAPTM
jgi:hypothetical protein